MQVLCQPQVEAFLRRMEWPYFLILLNKYLLKSHLVKVLKRFEDLKMKKSLLSKIYNPGGVKLRYI